TDSETRRPAAAAATRQSGVFPELVDHNHAGADRHAGIEIEDVLIHQAHAARGDVGADRIGLGRAVQTIEGVGAVLIEIERTRTERIAGATFHAAGIGAIALGFALDHRAGRRPARPCRLAADRGSAAEDQRFVLAHADAIAQRTATFEHEVEEVLWRI